MKANRIFETVLYSDDLDKAKTFYSEVLNMDLIKESDLFLVYRLAESVLLVFNPQLSREEDRAVPSHGAIGEGHIAFASSHEDIDQWKNHFNKHGIELEKVVDWEVGGTSIYIRDPAGNSVEFAPPTLWDGHWNFQS